MQDITGTEEGRSPMTARIIRRPSWTPLSIRSSLVMHNNRLIPDKLVRMMQPLMVVRGLVQMQVQMRVLMLAVMAVVEHNSVHVYMFLSHLFVKTYESKAV